MYRIFLLSKLHGATVSESNLFYSGSIGISRNLLRLSGMLPNEKVDIYNITNGARFSTYIIPIEEDSKIVINGAAARLCQKGDRLIIVNYAYLTHDEFKNLISTKVILDENNNVIKIIRE